MKRRWIIRGFFIGPLLLCIGLWGLSYWYAYRVKHEGRNVWAGEINQGKVWVEWMDNSGGDRTGWRDLVSAADSDLGSKLIGLGCDHWLGFYLSDSFHRQFGVVHVAIPIGAIASLLALVVGLVWLGTRPKRMGIGFPVLPKLAPIENAVVSTAESKTDIAWAALSMVMGIVSLTGGCLFVIPPIMAIVCGIRALRGTKKGTERDGMGMAVAGLLMGTIGLVLMVLGLSHMIVRL